MDCEERQRPRRENAFEAAGRISSLFFWLAIAILNNYYATIVRVCIRWVNPLLIQGRREKLELRETFKCPEASDATKLADELEE